MSLSIIRGEVLLYITLMLSLEYILETCRLYNELKTANNNWLTSRPKIHKLLTTIVIGKYINIKPVQTNIPNQNHTHFFNHYLEEAINIYNSTITPTDHLQPTPTDGRILHHPPMTPLVREHQGRDQTTEGNEGRWVRRRGERRKPGWKDLWVYEPHNWPIIIKFIQPGLS